MRSKREEHIEKIKEEKLLTGDKEEDAYMNDVDICRALWRLEAYVKEYGGNRELSLVKTKLEEALMWNVANIQGNGWEHPLDAPAPKGDASEGPEGA